MSEEELRGEIIPNRIRYLEIERVSQSPLVGLLNLETDHGTLRLAINREVGELIADEIGAFLRQN